MNFSDEKLSSEKREKNYFSCKLNIKDGNICYTHTHTHTHIYIYIIIYIYMKATIKIFTFAYIKKL